MKRASAPLDPERLDLGHLSLFVGLAVNQRVLERLEALGFRALSQSHGYLVQHLVEGPRAVGELAVRLGVTQQAVSKTVRDLEALGYLETLTSPEDARVRLVALSERGRACLAASRRTRAGLERRLRRKLGQRELTRAKRALLAALGELGGLEAVRQRRVLPPR